jgi:hypothetical protein
MVSAQRAPMTLDENHLWRAHTAQTMNGHPRDQISTDLAAGRPTISPVADPLVLRVGRLMSLAETEKFYSGLESRTRRSPAYADWAREQSRYLSEFDPVTTSAIESRLDDLHRRMVRRAKLRGWEVEGQRP